MVSKGGILLAIGVAVIAYYTYTNRYGGKHNKKPSPVVTTNYGQVKGVISISREGKQYYEYLGIPYAKPPTGNLRFEV